MSELTAYNSERIYWAVEQVEREAGDIDTLHLDDNLFYLKAEVDKVIAEKDKEIVELKEQVQEERSAKVNYKISANDLSDGLKDAYEEIKHHEYKRCLAMARWCYNQREVYERDSYNWELEDAAVDSLRNKANIMRKWRKRWLELAEKFKPSER